MKKLLMAPGPVPIHKNILSAFSKPIIHHRTDEFKAILKECLQQLQDVFQTAQDVMIIPGTGTAAMEASLVNTLSTNDNTLCVVNGKFAQRWQTMANNYQLKTTVHKIDYNKKIDLNQFEQDLKNSNYKAVLCQAVETSTGNIFPIKEMGKIIKKVNSKTLFIVDGITAVGVSPINMSIPEIDVLIAGAQKAFMLPTGLSFICLSPLAWSYYETSNLPKYYFDLKQELINNKKNQTRFSSPVNHITALNYVLKEFTGQKRLDRISYSQSCSLAFQKSIRELKLNLFSAQPSPSITAIKVPDHIDGIQLKSDINTQHNIVVMGGQDALKGQILRVGHMGYIQLDNYRSTLTALQKCLSRQDSKFDSQLLQNSLKQFNNSCSKDYHDYFNY